MSVFRLHDVDVENPFIVCVALMVVVPIPIMVSIPALVIVATAVLLLVYVNPPDMSDSGGVMVKTVGLLEGIITSNIRGPKIGAYPDVLNEKVFVAVSSDDVVSFASMTVVPLVNTVMVLSVFIMATAGTLLVYENVPELFETGGLSGIVRERFNGISTTNGPSTGV